MSSELLLLVFTRFGQYRSENGGNVTVNSTTEDTSEGSRKRADKYGVTSMQLAQGLWLTAGSEAVRRVYVMSGVDGSILGEVDAPKRLDASMYLSLSAWEHLSKIICMWRKPIALLLFIE